MKLGYYIANIQATDGGIYQYSVYVLKMLFKCNEIEQIVIFYSKEEEEEYRHLFSHPKIKTVLHKKNNWLKEYLKKISEFYLNRYYLKRMASKVPLLIYKLLNPDRRFLNRYKLDALHVPKQHSPAYQLKYPVIVSMHDVQQFHFPEFFTPLERIYKSISYYTTLCETEHVIVSYNHIKTDLIKYFPIAPGKITVCPVPLDEDWAEEASVTSIEELKSRYAIPDQIILTPAATWEHKNHIKVLEALAVLKKEGIKLFWVSTGYKTKFYKTIEERIQFLGLSDQVLFTGLVPDSDLKGLYKMAKLVVIPTLYEAGSGPLVEAMRYDSPVICSNVTSLPDTIGNEEFIFAPLDHSKIAGLIKQGLSDISFIERNKQNSRIRIKALSQQDYRVGFMNAYKKAISVKPNQ